MRKCKSCKAEISNDRWTICPECGADIGGEAFDQNESFEEPVRKTITAEDFEHAEVREGLAGESAKKLRKAIIIFQGITALIFIAIFVSTMFFRSHNTKKTRRNSHTSSRRARQHAAKNKGETKVENLDFDEIDAQIRMDPNDGVLRYKKGNMLLAANRFEEAIAEYEKTLELNSDYVNSYYGIGQAKRRLSDFEGSLDAFDKMVKARPDFWQAWGERAVTCYMMGNTKEYERSVKKVTDLTGKSGFEAEAVRRAKYEQHMLELRRAASRR